MEQQNSRTPEQILKSLAGGIYPSNNYFVANQSWNVETGATQAIWKLNHWKRYWYKYLILFVNALNYKPSKIFYSKDRLYIPIS